MARDCSKYIVVYLLIELLYIIYCLKIQPTTKEREREREKGEGEKSRKEGRINQNDIIFC